MNFHTDQMQQNPIFTNFNTLKKTSKNLLLAVIVKQTELLCEEMKKAPTHWDDLSEYFFMGNLNVIFQSQIILNSNSLFYTAEKLEEKKETEDTNHTFLNLYLSWMKENHTL